MLRRIKNRIKRQIYSPRLAGKVRRPSAPLTRLGTRYGGWHIAIDAIPEDGWVMLCGAGEDISFDLKLAEITNVPIVVVDPTPRAIEHWEAVKASYGNGTLSSVFRDYPSQDPGVKKIHFVPVAIWNEKGHIKFWEPENPAHVSYSATNLQDTLRYIEVPCSTPKDIAQAVGLKLDKLSVVKLDIEGAEGKVVNWFLENDVRVPQILLEFDELTKPSAAARDAVVAMTERLIAAGYLLVNIDPPANYVFMRQ